MFMTSGHTPPPNPRTHGTSWKIHHEWISRCISYGEIRDFPVSHSFFFPGCLVMKKHPQVWWVLAISLLVLEGLAGWRKNHPKKGLLPILPLVFQKPFFNEGLQQLPFNRFLWCFSLFLSLVSPCCSLPCPPHPAVAQCAMAPRFGLGSGQGSPSHWPGRTTGAERAADGWAAACPGGVAPREGETWRRLLGKIRGGNCEVGNFWVSVW